MGIGGVLASNHYTGVWIDDCLCLKVHMLQISTKQKNQGERNQGEHDLRNILISITRNRVRHNNNRNPAVMDASIINGIIRNWKTTYNPDLNTLQEVSCVICLEQFAQNEEVIALHCSKAHIFHQE